MFVWGQNFADKRIANFWANYFSDQGFPLATPIIGDPHVQFVFTVVTMPCSASCFQIQVFCTGANSIRAFSVLFIGAHQRCISGRRHLPVDKCNRHRRNLMWSPVTWKSLIWNNSREPYCLHIHKILQKWNSYRFVSRTSHKLQEI